MRGGVSLKPQAPSLKKDLTSRIILDIHKTASIAGAAPDGRQLKLDEARRRHVNRQMGRLATQAGAQTERKNEKIYTHKPAHHKT